MKSVGHPSTVLEPGIHAFSLLGPNWSTSGKSFICILACVQNTPCAVFIFSLQRYVVGKQIGDNLDIHKCGVS